MSSAFEGLPKTPNLKLNKPGYDNVADIEALNENADILDGEIQGIKNDYLPLSGGQMTGFITRNANDGVLALSGGINAEAGATLMLYGKDKSNGKFLIKAHDGNIFTDLVGYADSKLTWKNKNIVRSVNGINAGDDGNVDLGIIPIAKGGTGASTVAEARKNLGLGSVATLNTVPIANGGTGATTKAGAQTNLGLNDAIVGLSVSGRTITYTQADGGTGTITTQDTVSVTPKRYITTTYISGKSWYEVYNDGWVRQGGLATAQNTTYTFLKPFKNTDFSFTTGLHHFFSGHNQGVTIKSMSATSFQLNMWYGEAGSGNGNTRWVAEGYGA